MDHEYNVLGGYIPSFAQHVKDTGTRLGLRAESRMNEDRVSAGDAEPRGWAPAEHDAFFRALSVHSRWRPDLIAACVPTRTEWEVWMYLEALEEDSATLATQRGGEDVNMDMDTQDDRSPDVHSHSGSDMDDVCEPALEVSQAWIDVEEQMAAWIVHEEHLASLESGGSAAADTEHLHDKPPKRKRGRSRGGRRGRAQSQVRRSTVSDESSYHPSSALCSPSPSPTSTSACKRQALMGRLKAPHLMVLDGILREDDEAMKEKNKSREGSVTVATPIEHGDEGVACAGDVQRSTSSHRITAPQGTSKVSESPSNVVIEPVLLALSGGVSPAGCQSGRVPDGMHIPVQGPSTLPNASSQPTSLEVSSQQTCPIGSGTLAHPDPTANVESDLSLFSPRSRRRIQKRLYMRRKRALLCENGAASEGTVYTGIERLKPGKKVRSELSDVPAVSVSASSSKASSDSETRVPENMPKKNKPGLTLPYRLKAQFSELGIDAAYLRGQGMDLLNLGALGKLMGLYSSLEHNEDEADDPMMVESIDGQLIPHLQAALVLFVTDMVHRTIVWREREIRLKQRSRAWGLGDHVTISAVEHAVEAIGARYHDHKAYFKSLGASSSGPAKAPKEASPDVDAVDRFSAHRNVYTPLIRPPSAWKMGALSCLTRTYEEEATEEDLMADETDQEALDAVLEAEDKTDMRDMEKAAAEEERLWDDVV